MKAKRRNLGRPSCAESLAWLDRRLNYERMPPGNGTFTLSRMRRLLSALGSPQRLVPVIHVAGTKGKGSTSAMIAGILTAAGHRVGCYLSPHVYSIEERITVDGRPIDGESLAAAFATVMPVVDAFDRAAVRRGGRGPSWFEVLTAVALVHFGRARVDVAVMETGLGGRLDATNVTRPILSVITSISLDHMHLLGGTIEKIAGEKAGIIKRGVPVVSGATHPAARRVIRATAARRRSSLLELGRDFEAGVQPGAVVPGHPLGEPRIRVSLPTQIECAGNRERTYRIRMPGPHQAENAALAVVAVRWLDTIGYRVPERAIVAGLRRVRLPARIQVVSRRPFVVVDAAHNAASMRALMATLSDALAAAKPRVLVFAASADKQIGRMLRCAVGRFDRVIVTRYATNPRAASIDQLLAECRLAGFARVESAASPREAFVDARRIAGRNGLVCVAGSFFLAAEIGRR